MKKEQLVKKWIEDMVKHGFMQGWTGDKSEQFKRRQYDVMMKVLDGDVRIIGGNYRLLAVIHSDYANLKQYCGWSEGELRSLLELFGFTKIEEVIAMMNCSSKVRDEYMENGKYKKGSKSY